MAAATAYTGAWEGTSYVAYLDTIASPPVWTICNGDTYNVKKGDVETREGCAARLRRQILEHEARMIQCAPQLWDVPADSYIAINDWAYNTGTGAACKSGLIRKVKAGDIRGACMELSRWVFAGGKVVKGLANRRMNGLPGLISERALCLRGLGA
ncbi:lysozyme [Aureimonas psammosilenae]|uniref:lysozyme n=1 Tax=Aureimonas psammosilenae TaxID=2495496 RepID=UPI001AEEDAB9|nr:lysozyme [Aureimonas psammosilenae]